VRRLFFSLKAVSRTSAGGKHALAGRAAGRQSAGGLHRRRRAGSSEAGQGGGGVAEVVEGAVVVRTCEGRGGQAVEEEEADCGGCGRVLTGRRALHGEGKGGTWVARHG
jgi:hypothetical protein